MSVTLQNKSLDEIFEDGTAVDDALDEAVGDAILFHKRMGYPIVVWVDGKVVWLQPDEIPVSPPEGK
jgi:hypothetical protein